MPERSIGWSSKGWLVEIVLQAPLASQLQAMRLFSNFCQVWGSESDAEFAKVGVIQVLYMLYMYISWLYMIIYYIYNANTSTWVFEVRKGAEETNTFEWCEANAIYFPGDVYTYSVQ